MKWTCRLLALLVVALGHAAYADNMFFILSGQYLVPGTPTGTVPSSLDNVEGGLTLDTTTGTILFANLSPEGFSVTDHWVHSVTEFQYYGNFVEFQSNWSPMPYGQDIYVDIVLPVTTLVGYTGGPLCSELYPCGTYALSTVYDGRRSFDVVDGEFSPFVAAPTPEPSTLLLVVTGASSLGLAWRKIRSS